MIKDPKLDDTNGNVNKILKELQDKDREIIDLRNQVLSLESVLHSKEAELRNIRSNRIFKLLSASYRSFKKFVLIFKPFKKYEIKENSIQCVHLNKADKPLVSIIIPVYNNAEYLKQCFDSALNQTYTNIEVVAVDDCSTDDRVKEILEEYSKKDKFKYYSNNANSGISITTNNAIMKATGEWFAFLDCDDWLDKCAIDKMILAFKYKAGSVYGYSNRYNYENKTEKKELVDFSNRPVEQYYENLQIGMYTTHLKVIHKSVFARVGLFEDKYKGTQDYDLALKTAFYLGDSAFAYLNEPVYYHRIHDVQTTQVTNDTMLCQTDLLKGIALKRTNIQNGTYDKSISFIILSFNKKEQTLECLNSIRKTVKMPYEIIVFDNHSSEDTIKFLKVNVEPIPEVKVIYSPQNLGCAGGREEAVKYATGEYFIVLDNDIILLDNWLPELIVRMENYENVAAVNCKVIFPDDTVQFNALKYHIEFPYITFTLSGFREKTDDMTTCDYEENDWAPGGATLFKANIYRQLQGLGNYPNSYEDNDASIQLKKMGFHILNSPASIVIHNHFSYVETKKVGKEYLEARYNEENLIKSSVMFYKRNGLIIRDDAIFEKMGLIGKSTADIVRAYDKRSSEI